MNNSTFNIQHSSLLMVCKDKNRTVVEYSLKDTNKPIGVSSYNLSEKLPSELEGFLPTSEEITQRLALFDEMESKS